MAFKYHYHEVVETIGQLFVEIFKGLRNKLVKIINKYKRYLFLIYITLIL